MTKFLTFLTPLFFLTVSVSAQVDSFFVYPNQTDPLYIVAQDSHFVAHNPAVTQINKLVIFVGGTGSSPKRIKYFPTLVANEGYHIISVAYPNSVAAVTCDSSVNVNCFDNYRQELMFGTPVSGIISVDSLNCIYTRALKLIQYLSVTFPAEGWTQYLNGSTFQWSKIITAGHSQGSGHAAYLSKFYSIDRVLMFSGANDYSLYYSAPAPWITATGQTPASSLFSFLHLGDESVGFANQYLIVAGFGMLSGGDDSTLVDNITTPYFNSHCLYTNSTPQTPGPSAKHGSTVVDLRTPLDSFGNPLFTPVWRYMLNQSLTIGIQEQTATEGIILYPNPTEAHLNIHLPFNANYSIKIYDFNGQLCFSDSLMYSSSFTVDVSSLSVGIYVVQISSDKNTMTRKFSKTGQ